MWWRNSRLDRIEANIERLAEISEATNRRIDRFVEATAQQIPVMQKQIQVMQEQIQVVQAQTEQFQQALEYLLSRDGS